MLRVRSPSPAPIVLSKFVESELLEDLKADRHPASSFLIDFR